jgi:hypothetical protein
MNTFTRFEFEITRTGDAFNMGASIRGDSKEQVERDLETDFPPAEGYVLHYVSKKTYPCLD